MNQLQTAGSQQGSYAPIFTDRFFLGLNTNRNKLRSPLGAYYSKFLTSNDALIDGTNTEVSNRLTLIRRPGNIAGIAGYLYSGNIPDVPDSYYSFHEINGVVRIFVDTPGAVYLWTSTAFIPIFFKGAGAGQAYFQGVGNTLYVSDAVESFQFIDSGFTSGVANPGNGLSQISSDDITSGVALIFAVNSFVVGQTVTVSGTTNAGGALNGTWIVTAATSSNFQFNINHADTALTSDTGFAVGVFSFGLVGPTTAPTVSVTQTGAGAVPWQASTWFSTMGILIDSHGSAQVLATVNANGTNPSSQFGLSGSGAPAWNQTTGGTTTDNTVTWTNRGPVGTWQPLSNYSGIAGVTGSTAAPAMIYDPKSGGFYAGSFSAGTRQTGATEPNFNGIIGSFYPIGPGTLDTWVCYGNAFNGQSPNLFKWRAGFAYPAFPSNAPNEIPDAILIEPSAPPAKPQPYPSNVPVYVQTSGGGTSAATPYDPWGVAAIPAGQPTIDNQLGWISLGSATWSATTQYNAWSSTNTINFNCVKDTANCLQVCVTSGVSGSSAPWLVWPGSTVAVAVGRIITDPNGFLQACTTAGNTGTTHPTWNTTIGGTTNDSNGGGTAVWINRGYAYGSITQDGTATWVNVGLKTGAVWTANQSYYIPKGGFSPPSQFDSYGGADIIDSNGNVEFAIVTGTSKVAPHPAWAAALGNTTDNSVVWFNNGVFSTIGIAWSTGYSYVYSFKSRSAGDVFLNPLTAPHGVGDAYGPFNPLSGLPTILPPPTGSGDGSVSTASPATTFRSSNSGAVITVSGLGSNNPAVDTIEIYRTSDGGATYFRLTDIVAPAAIGGIAQPWIFHDAIPDIANSTSDGLGTLTLAPTAGFNSPPPTGLISIVQHLGRIFGSLGNTVFVSNGPLVGGASQPAGNGFTSFNLGRFWSFPSPVVRLIATAGGLLVFTTSDLYIIAGGPGVDSLFSSILVPGLGLSSYNALCVNGNVIMLLTADNQLVSLDPNMGVSEIGFGIGDKINGINPTLAYLAYLVQGSNDKALYIANGSTGWYRCNPNQAPDSPISGPVWSPFATIGGSIGGIKAIAALEYTPGKHALFMGSVSSGQPVLVRDSTFTYFKDGGTVAGGGGSAYSSWATMGSIVLAEPGQLAELGFITADSIKVGTSPSVSVLLDEISDSYLSITAASFSTPNTTYTYTLASGIPLVLGMTITITGMTTSGNNGTFVITGLGGGTFTVVNASGHTESGQTAIGTQFEPLSGQVTSLGLPIQDSPLKYGTTLAPNSVFANRYYFLQPINGISPQAACCRHMQIKIDFGSTDTVENEIISLTIWGAHFQETG